MLITENIHYTLVLLTLSLYYSIILIILQIPRHRIGNVPVRQRQSCLPQYCLTLYGAGLENTVLKRPMPYLWSHPRENLWVSLAHTPSLLWKHTWSGQNQTEKSTSAKTAKQLWRWRQRGFHRGDSTDGHSELQRPEQAELGIWVTSRYRHLSILRSFESNELSLNSYRQASKGRSWITERDGTFVFCFLLRLCRRINFYKYSCLESVPAPPSSFWKEMFIRFSQRTERNHLFPKAWSPFLSSSLGTSTVT